MYSVQFQKLLFCSVAAISAVAIEVCISSLTKYAFTVLHMHSYYLQLATTHQNGVCKQAY
jgi:hypothetical protein